jgi:hypothetical protein
MAIDTTQSKNVQVGPARKFRLVAMGSVAVTLLLATPATAGSQDEDQHCVVRLVAISQSDGGVISAAPEEVGCFPTLEEALEAGTGGEVALPPGTSPLDLTQSVLDGAMTAASDVLIGTEYDATGFLGGSRNFFAASGCAGTTWQVPNVGATWNDRFESGKGFGTCDHNRKFEHDSFDGAVVLCTPNCSTYGSLRNEVTSLRWAD